MSKSFGTLWIVACQSPLCLGDGISQARILEWVFVSFSWGSSRPRDWIHMSCISGGFFTAELPGKLQLTHGHWKAALINRSKESHLCSLKPPVVPPSRKNRCELFGLYHSIFLLECTLSLLHTHRCTFDYIKLIFYVLFCNVIFHLTNYQHIHSVSLLRLPWWNTTHWVA